MAIGGISEQIIDTATEFAVLGLNPLQFLRLTDPVERAALQEIQNRLIKRKELWDNNLAVKIAENLSRIMPH